MSIIKPRIFEKNINEWFLNSSSTPLVVRGARQVGKTTSIIHWMQESKLNYVYIDFFNEQTLMQEIIKASSYEEIIKIISLNKNIDLKKLEIVFFDEIQVNENLLYTTRLFKDKKIKLICSGSLLGLKLSNKTIKTDVGSKLYLDVFPLDFQEFLLWTNHKNILNEIIECFNQFKKINDLVHKQILKLFDYYILVGGMPKVVIEYINNDYSINENIYKFKQAILNDYINDNNKVIEYNDNFTNTNIKLANIIYERIDQYIINQNSKRFIIDDIGKNYRFRNIMIPIDLLKHINIVYLCNNLESIAYPLNHHIKESFFKLYYSDIGLLVQKLKLKERDLVNWENNISISAIMGGIIENAVVCNLQKQQLYYWSNKINGKTYEVDLIFEDHSSLDIIPVEIKSKPKLHQKSSSLNRYINLYHPKIIYCIGPNNFHIQDNKYFVPYYASFLLRSKFR